MFDVLLKNERRIASLFIAASFVLFSIYSAITPLFEASDELWHYPVVQRILSGNGLPIQQKGASDADAPWRQEGSQPPLYYYFAALISAPFDHSQWRAVRQPNIHSDMGVPTADGNANAMLHTAAEDFPWRGAALAIHAARFASVLLSTLTMLFAYLIAGEFFTRVDGRDALLRLTTMVFVACVPMFAFISGSINNDNAAVFFSTLGFWFALRLLRQVNLSVRAGIIAGVITACGALSKSSALGLLGLFGVASLMTLWRHTPHARFNKSTLLTLIKFNGVMLTVTLLISGWWFVRNITLYGDWLGWNGFLDAVGRRDGAMTWAQLWSERGGFADSYWGVFGTLNVLLPEWLYTALNVMAALAFIGLIRAVISRCNFSVFNQSNNAGIPHLRTECAVRNDRAAVLLALFWVALIFVALIRWTSLTPASQGRLMFPCIAVIGAAMAYGLARIHRVILLMASALMIALAVAVPFWIIAPTYAPPPNAWQTRLPIAINATFGDALTLTNAGADTAQVQPDATVTLRLNWQLDKPLNKNYSVFVHLVDESGVIVAQRDMHPGQGNLATSQLNAPRIWSDHYTLRISSLEFAPKTLHWRVGIYDAASGARLKTSRGAEWVEFGTVNLIKRDSQNALLRYDNGAQLRQYDISQKDTRAGGTIRIETMWVNTNADNMNVSLQLLDERANKIAQQDLGLPKQATDIRMSHTLKIDSNAKPGAYRLMLVLYEAREPFTRAGAYSADGVFAGREVVLTKFDVR